ncbi:MAG: hypothetical protein R6V77_03235, partial [Candidatus Cloacimonadaceae bacterium]
MTKYITMALLLLPILLSAQYYDSDYDDKTGFHLSGTAGYITVGSQTYTQLRLMPEFSIYKFGMGLDLDLLIDSELHLRKDDWNEPKDLLEKVYYIRFADRKDLVYMKAGGFNRHKLGHGLIMNDYTNRLLYPAQRDIGIMLGCNLNLPFQPGMEIFTSNVLKNQILTAHAHFKPFVLSEKKAISDLTVGAMVATDRNQYGKFKDRDKDGVPDVLDPNNKLKNYIYDLDGDGLYNSETPNADGMYITEDPDMDGDGILDSPLINSYVNDNVHLYDPELVYLLDNEILPLCRFGSDKSMSIIGLTFSIPLLDEENFKFEHYGEYAKITDNGFGVIYPGFYTRLLVFDLNLEGRKYTNEFLPAYFDHFYEDQRSVVFGDTVLVTKEQMLSEVKSCLGWYGRIAADIAESIIVSASFQDMYGDITNTGKSITGEISFDSRLI